MNTARWWLGALGLAATIAMNGCLCGNEEHAVTVSSHDSLTVTRDGVTSKVGIVTRLTAPLVSAATLEFVFHTVEGAASGEGVALSLSGIDPASNELVALTLALPVALRRDDEYSVGPTFTIEPGSSDPRLWGAHDLQQPNQAEAAFAIATYSFPPGQYTASFRAVASTGTIRITQRRHGSVELLLNLSFADTDGKTTTVTGRVQVNSEQFTICN